MNMDLLNKYNELKKYLESFGSIAVAFSSGVDSTFLLYAAKEALGDKAIAITAVADAFPEREMREADEYCKKMGIRHFQVRVDQFAIDGFSENPKNRCYLCKRGLFQEIIAVARSQGIIEIAEGSNLDDNGDYRPGLQAVAELNIKSPLRYVGFTKQEIRDLSEYFHIPTWNKPSFACLASRFPYGDAITHEKLRMVDKGEQLLMDMGFSQFRVRIHGDVARIELLPTEFDRFMSENIRQEVYETFKEYGFSYVALDIYGYRTGSMNENIESNRPQ